MHTHKRQKLFTSNSPNETLNWKSIWKRRTKADQGQDKTVIGLLKQGKSWVLRLAECFLTPGELCSGTPPPTPNCYLQACLEPPNWTPINCYHSTGPAPPHPSSCLWFLSNYTLLIQDPEGYMCKYNRRSADRKLKTRDWRRAFVVLPSRQTLVSSIGRNTDF
jgi:hypothetical protein